MDYETTNVSGSKGFFQVERVQWAVLLKTTGCSWRPFFIAIGRGFRGVIFPSALAISAWYIPRFSRWAKRGVWKRMFEHLAKDADNEYAMIDSTIVRAHQHSAGALKKGAQTKLSDGAREG